MRTLLSALVLSLVATALAAGPGPWSDVAPSDVPVLGERLIEPQNARVLRLDWGTLEGVLGGAPAEGALRAKESEIRLALPLPDGTDALFAIEEAPIMAPLLAARYPGIRTYRGQGVDVAAATLRFDVTPAGFHASILGPGWTVYIDPWQRGDRDHYMSYDTRAYRNEARAAEFECGVTGSLPGARLDGLRRAEEGAGLPNGDILRTYRLAVGATGEYTAFHSVGTPTVAEGLAAIVTAMNRVNQVYERDVALRMVLVATNDQVVFTDPATDPYTNNSGSAMLGQNQATLDSIIGSANYDIGHVFSTGGGGIASLGVPCVSGAKARGVTGLTAPIGDPFYIDYVAHEMGHQWDGNHTFNGNAGACSGGNRNGPTAYEPGSGSTIQAYAGICGSQNIQGNSDDYFHNISYVEIVSYIQSGSGASCDAPTATGNAVPVVDAGLDGLAIPLETPFELCGSATDADTDAGQLTYTWEEFDLGPAGHPDSPVADAPIFRSFTGTNVPCRSFPRLDDLVSGTHTIGELLPTYARNLTFRLTVRDNEADGGAVDFQEVAFTVTDAAGPFLVTAPNTADLWKAGESETVTWDVAGTDLAPVSCGTVDLRFSADGGYTYPVTLLAGTPNDGSATVTGPAIATTTARVRVECADNVFFDISDVDFETLGAEIFADGFESGDVTRWSSSVP